jgi:hypothetical protein
VPSQPSRNYLERPAKAEDAIVGLFGRQALEGELDDVVLLGNQVIGSVTDPVSPSIRGREASREREHEQYPESSSIIDAFGELPYLRPSCL